MIELFRREYAWLSNFYEPSPITYKGVTFNSVEAAFQAQKIQCASEGERRRQAQAFSSLGPLDAKRKGRNLPLRPDWEDVKLLVMENLLRLKFSHPVFRKLLLETGDQGLREGNHWHDNFWGSCTCDKCSNRGLNHLGRLLMKIRAELRQKQ